jgi:hypothetical protein
MPQAENWLDAGSRSIARRHSRKLAIAVRRCHTFTWDPMAGKTFLVANSNCVTTRLRPSRTGTICDSALIWPPCHSQPSSAMTITSMSVPCSRCACRQCPISHVCSIRCCSTKPARIFEPFCMSTPFCCRLILAHRLRHHTLAVPSAT